MLKKISGYRSTIGRHVITIILLLISMHGVSDVIAQTESNTVNFNHSMTAFPLVGAHRLAQCESCHIGGLFKGTPTACAGCHTTGQRVAATLKSPNHIVSSAPCETCHSSISSFAGAKFSHNSVQAKTCLTCHNGAMAPGKSAAHLQTAASCDSCHMMSAWLPAKFSHTEVDPGRCGTCHGGQTPTAMPKSAGHIATVGGMACDACHANGYTSFSAARMNHNVVATLTCSTCHNGAFTSENALGKTPTHVATSAECSTCHTSFTTFLGAVFSHAAVVPGTCGSCHGGQSATTVSKPAAHIPTTGNACDSCHTKGYVSFAAATMNHAVIGTTSCSTCHNGAYVSQGTQGALAKPINHIPTTITGSLDCNTCHIGTTSWTSEKMNHNGAMTGCKVCHNSTATYLGNMFKMTLGNHKQSTTANDCSQSGCHRPLGTFGRAYSAWN